MCHVPRRNVTLIFYETQKGGEEWKSGLWCSVLFMVHKTEVYSEYLHVYLPGVTAHVYLPGVSANGYRPLCVPP